MVFEKIKEILSSQFEVEADSITLETDIVDDLGADSLDLVELLTSLEDEFGIVITDERANELRTVGQVVEFIETLL